MFYIKKFKHVNIFNLYHFISLYFLLLTFQKAPIFFIRNASIFSSFVLVTAQLEPRLCLCHPSGKGVSLVFS